MEEIMPLYSKTRLLKQGILLGGCLMLGNVWAGGPEIAPVLPGLPLPGVSLYGMAGNGWTAIADAMIPFAGLSEGFLYIDPQFYFHSGGNGYSGNAGLGYRRLVDNNIGILGAYVFGDYNRGIDDSEFWFVSPGIERLGTLLDFSANAYIPVSSQRKNTGLAFADEVGDSSQIVFSGHDQFDALVNTFTSTGVGGDIQVGVHMPFFRNSEIYFGGYYFAPKDTDNIGGGSVRLQVPVNRYISALVSEAYDSEFHNTIKAGLTLWFGGRSTGYDFNGNLVERLVDPIQRSLVFVAGGALTGDPIVSDFEDTGQTALEATNISFFIPNASPPGAQAVQGNGTFENPYVGISQDNVNDANIQNNRTFYVDSGVYNPVTYGSGNDYIILNNDHLFGRQNDFREAAEGSSRPLIQFADGGFEVPSTDLNDSFTGLQLSGANVNGRAGIWINHENGTQALDVSIDNLSIRNFGDGIDILNGGSSAMAVNVNNSWISDNNGTGELLPFGVTGGIGVMNDFGTGKLQVNLNNTTVTTNNKSFDSQKLIAVGGMAAASRGDLMTINVDSSAIINNSISITNSNVDAVGGLAIVGIGSLPFMDSANPSQETSPQVTLNANDSTFSNNSISLVNGNYDAVGGLAADTVDMVNPESPTIGVNMALNICKSEFSDNLITASSATGPSSTSANDTLFGSIVVNAAGGLAANVSSGGSTMTLKVDDSSFIRNTINNTGAFNSSTLINAAGGLAARNTNPDILNASTLTLNINNSIFSNNSILLAPGGTINTAGGLAVSDASFFLAADTIELHLSHSNILDNTISNDGAGMDVAGGLAVRGQNGTIIVDVDSSNISDNTVSVDNGGFINSAGGFAFANHLGLTSGGVGSLSVNINNTNITGNTISVDHNSVINAGGGLAYLDDSSVSNTPFHVSGSNISGNYINANHNSGINSAGGFAIDYVNGDEGGLTVSVDHSSISNNVISFNNGSGGSAGGGIAIFDNQTLNTLSMSISHSDISNNSVVVEGGSSFFVAGGVAAYNIPGFLELGFPNEMLINIDHSKIFHNSVSEEGDVIDVIGGVAAENAIDPNNENVGGTLTINVEKSALVGNAGSGVGLEGAGLGSESLTTANIDQSIIAKNELFGLSAVNGATIDVTKPTFFNGVVNIQGGSSITFPDIGTLFTNTQVFCLFGQCKSEIAK
jgi:hypothetical protein